LAKDEDYIIRQTVASHPNCPESLKLEMQLSDMI
jgi:hypothetical protein